MSPYEVLGVREGSDKAECKRAYRKLCIKYHPDNGGSPEMFDRINKAWAMIDKGTRSTFTRVHRQVVFDNGLFKYKII